MIFIIKCNSESVGPSKGSYTSPLRPANSIVPCPTSTSQLPNSHYPVSLPMGSQPASSRPRLRKTVENKKEAWRRGLAGLVRLWHVGLPCLCGYKLFHFHLRRQLAILHRLKAAPGTGQRLIRLQALWAFDLLAAVNDLCCQPDSPGSRMHIRLRPAVCQARPA